MLLKTRGNRTAWQTNKKTKLDRTVQYRKTKDCAGMKRLFESRQLCEQGKFPGIASPEERARPRRPRRRKQRKIDPEAAGADPDDFDLDATPTDDGRRRVKVGRASRVLRPQLHNPHVTRHSLAVPLTVTTPSFAMDFRDRMMMPATLFEGLAFMADTGHCAGEHGAR